MAFKAITEYNEERFGNLFRLDNDGDFADVVFMYRSMQDALVADVHYIKSADYSGYVHCCGRGCPACAKGIRVQNKLFIPLYDINSNQVVFWDRNVRFQRQLDNDVFNKFPNPSEYVFRITRKGASGDINTSYSIVAVGKNTVKSYENIKTELHISFPDYYSVIVREYSIGDLKTMLDTNPASDSTSTIGTLPDYQVTPRKVIAPTVVPESFPSYNIATTAIDEPEVNLPDDDIADDIGDDVIF